MPKIEVQAGVQVHVQDVGAGPAVVLLAGFGLSHVVWDRQIRVLLDHGRRVVCVDLRGTGGSDKPATGYEVDRLAQDVEVVLTELGLEGAALCGWSFGGQVAFRLAARAPGLLDRLVLVTSNAVRASRSEAFPFGAPPDDLERRLIDGERRDRLAARRGTLQMGFAASPAPVLLDHLLAVQLAMPSWAAIECFRSYLRTDLGGDLGAVRLPVVQIMGERDPVMPLAGAHWLQQRLPSGRLTVLPGVGHYPMFEDPDAFDAALLEAVGP